MSSIPSSKRGFTLVELFTVVVIVALLFVVLYPVFGQKARENSRHFELSNQKQVALAFLMYAQDNDERYPPVSGYVASTQPLQSWGPDRILRDGRKVPGLLSPYTRNNAVFLNPQGQVKPENGGLELLYNDLIARQQISAVATPSVTVLITSSENRWNNVGHALATNAGPQSAVFGDRGNVKPGQGATIGDARLRHKVGAYFGFADGHVKWFKGGADDPIFFPPRESSSRFSVDAKTKRPNGPNPGKNMLFNGKHYQGTFHIQ